MSALALIVAGCGPEPGSDATGPAAAITDLGLGPSEIVPVAPDQGHPRVSVRANFFGAGGLSTEPLSLTDRYVLDFIPLVQSAQGTVELETRAVVDGEERVLGTHPAFDLSTRVRDADRSLSLLRSRIQLDLSDYRDSEITLRWGTVGDAPEAVVGLGNVMLRRKDPSSSRPDVLLICSDTHRFDHAIGGQGPGLMPNLQDFARESVVYESAFSNASWTLPSVASVLTGLFPRYHVTGEVAGTVDAETYNAAGVPAGQFAFKTGKAYRLLTAYPPALRTLPEYLRDIGYSTAIVAANPLYFLSGLAFDGHDIAVDTGVVRGGVVNALALDVIETSEPTKPLFLLVHLMDVHQWAPWYFDTAHPDTRRTDAPAEVRSSYAEAVRDTDAHVQSLLDAWKTHRDLDNTLVAFFSDHGEHLLDDPAQKRLGHGNTMAEQLLHVPLIVKFPGGTAGRPPANAVSLVDLLPTILETAGADAEGAFLSGQSMRGQDPLAAERTIFADYQLYGNLMSSVRRRETKLVLDLQDDGISIAQSRLVALHDAAQRQGAADRDSLVQAYLEYAEAARRMTVGLDRDQVIDQEEAARRLRALGYIR